MTIGVRSSPASIKSVPPNHQVPASCRAGVIARGGLQRPRPDGDGCWPLRAERRLCGDGTGRRRPRHPWLDAGYLADVRALRDAHHVLLIFDDSEDRPHRRRPRRGRPTGRQAGPDHAGQSRSAAACHWRLRPESQRKSCRSSSTTGWRTRHHNGNRAVHGRVPPPSMRIATCRRWPRPSRSTTTPWKPWTPSSGRYELPAHTVGFGVKGGDLVTDPDPQLPRLQVEHRFEAAGTGLAVGHQPRCPDALGHGRSVGWILAGAPMRTWPSGSTPSVSWAKELRALDRGGSGHHGCRFPLTDVRARTSLTSTSIPITGPDSTRYSPRVGRAPQRDGFCRPTGTGSARSTAPPRRAGIADDAVVGRPLARFDAAVDAGALHAEHRS